MEGATATEGTAQRIIRRTGQGVPTGRLASSAPTTGFPNLPERAPAMHNGNNQTGDCPMSERSLADAVLRQSLGDGTGGWERPAPESRQTNQGEGT